MRGNMVLMQLGWMKVGRGEPLSRN